MGERRDQKKRYITYRVDSYFRDRFLSSKAKKAKESWNEVCLRYLNFCKFCLVCSASLLQLVTPCLLAGTEVLAVLLIYFLATHKPKPFHFSFFHSLEDIVGLSLARAVCVSGTYAWGMQRAQSSHKFYLYTSYLLAATCFPYILVKTILFRYSPDAVASAWILGITGVFCCIHVFAARRVVEYMRRTFQLGLAGFTTSWEEDLDTWTLMRRPDLEEMTKGSDHHGALGGGGPGAAGGLSDVPANCLAGEGSQFLEVGGIRVHYQEVLPPPASRGHGALGDGAGGGGVEGEEAAAARRDGTAVLLLHGYGGGVFSWRHVMEDLAAQCQCRVVAFDRPGFGLTSRPTVSSEQRPSSSNPYALDSQAELLLQLCSQLGLSTVALVAHADASPLALRTASMANGPRERQQQSGSESGSPGAAAGLAGPDPFSAVAPAGSACYLAGKGAGGVLLDCRSPRQLEASGWSVSSLSSRPGPAEDASVKQALAGAGAGAAGLDAAAVGAALSSSSVGPAVGPRAWAAGGVESPTSPYERFARLQPRASTSALASLCQPAGVSPASGGSSSDGPDAYYAEPPHRDGALSPMCFDDGSPQGSPDSSRRSSAGQTAASDSSPAALDIEQGSGPASLLSSAQRVPSAPPSSAAPAAQWPSGLLASCSLVIQGARHRRTPSNPSAGLAPGLVADALTPAAAASSAALPPPLGSAGPLSALNPVNPDLLTCASGRHARPPADPARWPSVVGLALLHPNLTGHMGPTFSRLLARSGFGRPILRSLLRTEVGEVANRRAWHQPDRLTPEVMELYKAPLRVEGWDLALVEMARLSSQQTLGNLHAYISDAQELPVLLVTAVHDCISPPAKVERLWRRMPHAKLAVLPECGHISHEEAPARLLEQLAPFCAQLVQQRQPPPRGLATSA